MIRITIRFYADLNDFLLPDRRRSDIEVSTAPKTSVKDIIESFNVPHVEVGLIVANGVGAGFDYRPMAGDRIGVYPMFSGAAYAGRPRGEGGGSVEEARFAVDVNLGRLASYLRLLGFDTAYRNDFEDEALAALSSGEDRILLSRDVGLLKRKTVRRGCFVRATEVGEQTAEILLRYDLFDAIRPFTRCSLCNGALRMVEKEKIIDRLQLRTAEYFNEFFACGTCSKIYWRGSHYENMMKLVDSLRRKRRPEI